MDPETEMANSDLKRMPSYFIMQAKCINNVDVQK